jgi:pimeloyl-ACP methyl ester carboxylesterase
MPFVKIDDLSTYYEIHGVGETIVLLHNGFSCAKMWEEISPFLVESGYRVLMYDRRGYGRSDGGPDFDEQYKSDDFRAECVAAMALLIEAVGIESFHIVGQCEGGVVGVDYAIRYPAQVKTLATASTMCYSTQKLEAFDFNASFASTFMCTIMEFYRF